MILNDVVNDDMPLDAWLAQLRQAKAQDKTYLRQTVMLRLLWQEAYFTRPGLIARVEALLGQGCFGSAPHRTFRRDLTCLRRALTYAGYRLAYSRRSGQAGYYIMGRPSLDERLRWLIAGAVAEVDPQQIAIYRRLAPAQRVWQLGHLSDWLRLANERRLNSQRKAA
ncbi:MAG: hypothetical protein HYR94_14220 [Chloroflexi bacterium]|nr:hypothetical protein [Chloroflexota bacterium]